MYSLGVDIGGMSIKYGIVKDDGKIIDQDSFPIDHSLSQDDEIYKLCDKLEELIKKNNVDKKDILGVGVGCPGQINSDTNTCDLSFNLNWKKLPIGKLINERTGFKVKCTNDANAACLAESKFGKAVGMKNVAYVTLGTGIGSGFVIEGKIYEGKNGKGAEFGHNLLKLNGRKCTCGRKGCFEAYASVTALIKDTAKMMRKHKDSRMWEFSPKIKDVSGRCAFSMYEKDVYAKKVVDHYIYYLTEGLMDIVNIFRPDMLLLGGGLSNEGQRLIDMIYAQIEKNPTYFGEELLTKIDVATLKNKAGIIGAASLFF